MAISEESRHHLYLRLEAVLGSEEATTLMEHLPPVGWADVATKQDLDALRVATGQDLDALRVATGQEFAALRVATGQDIDALRVATGQDIDALRVATGQEFAALRHELELSRVEVQRDLGSVEKRFHSEINRLVSWLVPTMITVAGLAVAVARLA